MKTPLCKSVVLLLVLLASMQLSAQEIPDRDDLESRALVFRLRLELMHDEQVIWRQETVKLTLPGRPVEIKLVHPSLTLHTRVTPYPRGGEQMMLVTQTQTVLREEGDEQSVRFFSNIQSLPVRFREPVYFFPLGDRTGNDNEDKAHIRLTMLVEPYRTEKAGSEPDEAAP